jgi:hypothetical protein
MILIDINDQILKDIIENKDLAELMHKPMAQFTHIGVFEDQKQKLVNESRCQFNTQSELTVLGFINGILPELTGKVLIENIDDNGKSVGYDIVEKWW